MCSHRPEDRVQSTIAWNQRVRASRRRTNQVSPWTLPSATRNASLPPTDSREVLEVYHHHYPPPGRPQFSPAAVLKHSHLAWAGELLGCTLCPRVLAGRLGAQAETTFCAALKSQTCLAFSLLASLLPFLSILWGHILTLHHLT